jgi:hypothetical protein
MKAYLITSGSIFGLLVVAHLWRVAEEGHLARDPVFILTTAIAAALGLWAWRLVRATSR